jgi:hypothetical protein
MKKIILCVSLLIITSFSTGVCQQYVIEAIDTPTANSIELGSYSFSLRLYKQGSILARLYYGIIMRNLTLGLSIDGENIVGTGTVKPRRPYLFIKLPLYTGDETWPILSLGFDEQGLGDYNDDINEYEIKPMGFFVVLTKEGIAPGLNVSIGANANYSLLKDAERKIYGFCNANFMVGPEFMLLAELKEFVAWDSYLNLGAKYLLTPELNFEFSALNVGGNSGEPERIIRVTYTKMWGEF